MKGLPLMSKSMKAVIPFLGACERLHDPGRDPVEFDGFTSPDIRQLGPPAEGNERARSRIPSWT